MEEFGSAAMLAAKRSAAVAPEVNFREHAICIPLPSVYVHLCQVCMYTSAKCVCTPLPSFATQRRRHQKSKTGVYQWPHKKDLCSPNFFLKKGTRRYLTNSKILIFKDLNHLINKFQKYLFSPHIREIYEFKSREANW